MENQPMLQSTASTTNSTIEEVSSGCLMHRYKGQKAKRRWGQLRVELTQKLSRCIIRLYKHDVLNVYQEINRSKEPKLKYELEFTSEDFCGLEKGEHFDRHGQRRYLCIITKQKHLIIEDAVVTAAGINHNVLGTWYQLIAQVMQYVNKWKLVENNPKLANKICYLHISSENISECHSLEDKTRENRHCLVLRMWKTPSVTNIKERINGTEESCLTDLTFNVPDNSGIVSSVSMTVEGTINLRQLLTQFQKPNNLNRKKTTVCPGFDDLNYHPNLIPKQKPSKSLKKFLTKTSSNSKNPETLEAHRQKSSSTNNHVYGNLYVRMDSDEGKWKPPYYNVKSSESVANHSPRQRPNSIPFNSRVTDEPSTSWKGAPGLHEPNPRIQVPPSLLGHASSRTSVSDFMQSLPRSMLPSNGWNPHASPPQLPSPGFDDNDLKKAPALATQTSFDSDYQTGENLSLILTETSVSQSRSYINLQQLNSDAPVENGIHARSENVQSVVYQNLNPEQPPAVPARDDEQSHLQPYVNISNSSSPLLPERVPNPPPIPPKYSNEQPPPPPSRLSATNLNTVPPVPERPGTSEEENSRPIDLLASSIQQGTLPPLLFGEEEQQRAYENGIEFEISINDVLQGAHLDNIGGRWLDLPHSVFVRIALGLEKEGITVGDWKALAEKLGLTFHNVQQLSSLIRIHSMLRPLEVLLLHWSRTQSPVPFTSEEFKELLLQIGRDDLAQLIP